MRWCVCAPQSSNFKSVHPFLRTQKLPALTVFRHSCICLFEEAFLSWFNAILSVGHCTNLIPLFCEWMLMYNESANWTFYSPVVTICTASLTFNNSTFCPYALFMCFVWIWKQTATISLYGIDLPVFITETECVYCAVRAGSLYTIQFNVRIQRVHL